METTPESERPLPASRRLFFLRVGSALLLQPRVYREVAGDRHATGQAAGVVCLAALAQSVPLLDDMGLWGWPFKLASGALIWFCFSTAAYALARLSRKPAQFRPLLRVLGFAEAPGILNFVASSAVPALSLYLRYAIWAWIFATSFLAIEAATQAGTSRALLITVPSFLCRVLIGFVVFLFWFQLYALFYSQQPL